MRTVNGQKRGTEGALVSGIILAAGASTRLGTPKQLLPLGPRTLLQCVLDAAAASCLDEVVLVLGHRAEEIEDAIEIPPGKPVRLAINPDYACGQSSSLRLGLRSTDPGAVGAAILLGDQPEITVQLIDRAAAVFQSARAPVVRAVYTDTSGRRVPGHPVFLARSIWPEVEKLDADKGARSLLSSHPEWLVEVPVDGDPPADVDTWQDYWRVLGARRDESTSRSGA